MHCFSVERLVNSGQYIHFHSHMEIYMVVKGSASFTISGENRLLTAGQLAIADKYENHSIETEGQTELLILPVESGMLITFSCLYPNKKLPRWLMDQSINYKLSAHIESIEEYAKQAKNEQSQLRLAGMIYAMLADVIAHYPLESTSQAAEHDMELVAKVSQYIYEHYNERITLETLADAFHISPTVLSRKLKKSLGVDFRIFVNDLRVQKVMQMLNDPSQKGRSVYDIALTCGFKSMSTFYRCYKRSFNLGAPGKTEEK